MARRRSCRRLATLPAVILAPALLVACASDDGMFKSANSSVTADPGALMGLAPQQISEQLGAPELQRREPPAEVWQYRTSACVFNLYIYDEEEGRRAVHYTARSRANGAVDAAQCLGSIVERNRIASAGQTESDSPEQL